LLPRLRQLPPLLHIELGIEGVEVLAVELVESVPQSFAEALIVHHFPLPEEADSVLDVGIVGQAQDVVVGGAGFLFWYGQNGATS
jgi:hypothetical protein